MVERKAESPANIERLMEKVCERENRKQALPRVKANKGEPWDGRDDRPAVAGIPEAVLPAIREQLLSGTYQPPTGQMGGNLGDQRNRKIARKVSHKRLFEDAARRPLSPFLSNIVLDELD